METLGSSVGIHVDQFLIWTILYQATRHDLGESYKMIRCHRTTLNRVALALHDLVFGWEITFTSMQARVKAHHVRRSYLMVS